MAQDESLRLVPLFILGMLVCGSANVLMTKYQVILAYERRKLSRKLVNLCRESPSRTSLSLQPI